MQLIENTPVTGQVIGYKSSWNILSHDAFAVIRVNDAKINVQIDNRQIKYVEKEYPRGSYVRLQLNGSKWQIVSKPSDDEVYTPDDDMSLIDILDNPA
ncbi:MAG TPA: hypothetical protein VMC84_13435 [Methanocella sp.]|uniref:hypothetical protein n=1 Tax=Methanocella sp. TaxID=2052833 RepID=UPI002B5E3729|nr:hypothetical protein [Methanocella sp.]HTY92172.1 hypothetical protein [Methanocella sp.]